MPERVLRASLIALVAQIPFELRYTVFGLTNLQWTFVAFAIASIPVFWADPRSLVRDRLVQAAILFVFTQWIAACYAPEFNLNAFKAAIRVTAGLLLLAVVRASNNRDTIWRSWAIASGIAATYALVAYAGFGLPWLFRSEEFYIGHVQRLSGSFEYPNTAAAYFAMALPIVWWSPLKPLFRCVCAGLLWCALILTFSKGAVVALLLVVTVGPALARAKSLEWRKSMTLILTGVAACGVVILLNPYLVELFRGPAARNPIDAEYTIPWNKLEQQPAVEDEIRLTIRNKGILRWRADGWRRIALSFRWLDAASKTFVEMPPTVTALPRDIEPGETVEVAARFRTPEAPGKYVLAFELFRDDFDWLSRTGVIPVLVEAEIHPSMARSVKQADLSQWYGMGQSTAGGLTASVSRASLWLAALKMFLDHPFGVGPDNYRLRYGQYLGAARWDTHVYSNNLYLELLTGSGIPGLAAFGLFMLVIRWRLDPAYLAVAVFLVHGLVDVFLMATPIYFAFWILVGNSGTGKMGS